MVISFFVIEIKQNRYLLSPDNVFELLRFAGWSISDLKGRGQLSHIRIWLTAIAKSHREANKKNGS